MGVRFRIPLQQKETVSVVRRSAYQDDGEVSVATGIVCMLNPETDGRVRQDATQLREGVPIGQGDWSGILEKPNPAIEKGDVLRKADGTLFRIENILNLSGGDVMLLQLQEVRVL